MGEQKLKDFCWNLWDHTLNTSLQYAPPSAFLQDPTIKTILDNFASIITADDAATYVRGVCALTGHYDSLFMVICELREIFVAMKNVHQVERNEEYGQGTRHNFNLIVRFLSSNYFPFLSTHVVSFSSSTPMLFPSTAYDNFFANLNNHVQYPTSPQNTQDISQAQASDDLVVVDLSNVPLHATR